MTWGMALLFCSTADSAARWQAQLVRLSTAIEVRVWPEIGDPAEIDYALVWRPASGLLASLPNLKLILSLGAGIDHILTDPLLPRRVPIVRLVDPYLTAAMSEYVVLQVLRLHRNDIEYQEQQRVQIWRELPQRTAGERPVGILGFGEIGRDAARKLKGLGFPVAGWTRRPRRIAGFPTHAGAEGLRHLLDGAAILVCLLPLTGETEGILNAANFRRMPRGGGVVNAGRGGHLVEADLIPALDSGQLSAAALDVFRDEPLPPEHPFWRHERILITPHIAGITNPLTAAPVVLDNIRRFEAGRPLLHRVDPRRGY
jgi:glyoxylate/hydroxypyruvate reductase A